MHIPCWSSLTYDYSGPSFVVLWLDTKIEFKQIACMDVFNKLYNGDVDRNNVRTCPDTLSVPVRIQCPYLSGYNVRTYPDTLSVPVRIHCTYLSGYNVRTCLETLYVPVRIRFECLVALVFDGPVSGEYRRRTKHLTSQSHPVIPATILSQYSRTVVACVTRFKKKTYSVKNSPEATSLYGEGGRHSHGINVMMAQRIARRDWRSGGPRFKSHPRLTFQSWSSYQLNQLRSKAASDSTLKQLTTCGVSNTCTLLYFINDSSGREWLVRSRRSSVRCDVCQNRL